MRKIVLLAYASILLLSCIWINFHLIKPVRAVTTWTVDDDGPADFNKIQEAINAASAGDTIYVKTGTYYESVYINKNLSIIGESRDNTIIDLKNTDDICVQNTLENVSFSFSGFTVKNGRTGILLYQISGNNISDNIVINHDWYGIIVRQSDNTITSNNIVANNTNGIGVWDSFDNVLIGNTVTNQIDVGMEIWAETTTLRENTVSGNGFNFGARVNNDIDTSNTVNGKPIYNLINQHDLLIDLVTFPDIGYLALANSTNITIRDLTLNNNIYGLYLYGTTNSLIENVTASDNSDGFYILYGENNTIKGNSLSNYERGIDLTFSSKNQIVGNVITDSLYDGIFLGADYAHHCDYNQIVNNTITSNTEYSDAYAIHFSSYCSYNIIDGNNITQKRGISLPGASDHNVITRNTMTTDAFCFIMESTEGNIIYHNNFINKYQQVRIDPRYVRPHSVWDNGYPFGGNYWSDYDGTDLNNDGIGDAPYVIEYNQDRYPLTNPIDVSQPVHNLHSGLAYSTIQEAINAPETESGSIVTVDTGTYHENTVVDKALTLAGETNTTTTIDGDGKENSMLVVANDVSIHGFAITNAYVGIRIAANNSLINNVRVYGNHIGIWTKDCAKGVISDSIIINQTVKKGEAEDFGGAGIALDQCVSFEITGNTLKGNELIGVWVRGAYNLIENNIISNNMIGLELDNAGLCTVAKNQITKNCHGIKVDALNSSIHTNNIINNTDCGILLEESNNNSIYYNNFINNTKQVESYSSVNFWDDGCEGNYWSDYDGEDLDDDGIGDIPYVIDENNQDNYPLMNPYIFGDVNHDTVVNIVDIAIIAKAFHSYPGCSPPLEWNPFADLDNTGIITIIDVAMAAKEFGKEWEYP